MISLHNMLPFELTKDTPYLALLGELWSVFYEYFNRNWSCYKGFLLYKFPYSFSYLLIHPFIDTLTFLGQYFPGRAPWWCCVCWICWLCWWDRWYFSSAPPTRDAGTVDWTCLWSLAASYAAGPEGCRRHLVRKSELLTDWLLGGLNEILDE